MPDFRFTCTSTDSCAHGIEGKPVEASTLPEEVLNDIPSFVDPVPDIPTAASSTMSGVLNLIHSSVLILTGSVKLGTCITIVYSWARFQML